MIYLIFLIVLIFFYEIKLFIVIISIITIVKTIFWLRKDKQKSINQTNKNSLM